MEQARRERGVDEVVGAALARRDELRRAAMVVNCMLIVVIGVWEEFGLFDVGLWCLEMVVEIVEKIVDDEADDDIFSKTDRLFYTFSRTSFIVLFLFPSASTPTPRRRRCPAVALWAVPQLSRDPK